MRKQSLGSRIVGWLAGKPRAAVYAAATVGRLAADWLTQLLSSDQELKSDMQLLRARSRQITRDNPYIAGVARTFQDNVLGPNGIGIRPRIRRADGTIWKEANEAVMEAWKDFCRYGVCSMDGRGTFADKQRTFLRSWFTDGEALARLVHVRGGHGIGIQLLDPDQIDAQYNVPMTESGTYIRLGIETDEYGRILKFHLFRGHPSDPNVRGRDRVPVPAHQMLFMFDELRPSQIRGVPIGTPSILTTKINDEYVIATLMQARIGASGGGGFFETDKDVYSPSPDSPDGSSKDKSLVVNMQPGVSQQLPPGIRWVQNNPNYPQDVFDSFQRTMHLGISRSYGISYATFSGDLSMANYASGRRGALTERETWKKLQQTVADTFVCPVFHAWVPAAVLSGALKLPAGVTVEMVLSSYRVDFRGWDWDDPTKDVVASEKEIANRLNSRTRICAARGVEWEDILEELEEEENELKERGLPVTLSSTGATPNDQKKKEDDGTGTGGPKKQQKEDGEEEDDTEEDDSNMRMKIV